MWNFLLKCCKSTVKIFFGHHNNLISRGWLAQRESVGFVKWCPAGTQVDLRLTINLFEGLRLESQQKLKIILHFLTT